MSNRAITGKIIYRYRIYDKKEYWKTADYNKPDFVCFINIKKNIEQLRNVIHLLHIREIPLHVVKPIDHVYGNKQIESKMEG